MRRCFLSIHDLRKFIHRFQQRILRSVLPNGHAHNLLEHPAEMTLRQSNFLRQTLHTPLDGPNFFPDDQLTCLIHGQDLWISFVLSQIRTTSFARTKSGCFSFSWRVVKNDICSTCEARRTRRATVDLGRTNAIDEGARREGISPLEGSPSAAWG